MAIEEKPSPLTSFAAGAITGIIVDISLFPLDTLKTRVQSEQGFVKAGGFKQIYKGIGPTAAGSAPCAAIFFLTYNESKGWLSSYTGTWSPMCHIASASIAEVVVNLVKVPVEIVKQRRQTSGVTPLAIIRHAVQAEGLAGLYRGFLSTVVRDLPFSIIQFPMWEALKNHFRTVTGHSTTPVEGAFCGALSGATAAAITTPLDLAKTRIMLAKDPTTSMGTVLLEIYRTKGIPGLFAGFVPRTAFIFLGGGVFFGCYEFAVDLFETMAFSVLEDIVDGHRISCISREKEGVQDDIWISTGHPKYPADILGLIGP